jgi:hypothetical protein
MNSKRKEQKFVHISPVEQIIISKNNQLMISRSSDSVFVWNISERIVANNMTFQAAVMYNNESEIADSPEKIAERSANKSSRSFRLSNELDDVVLFRKARATPYLPPVPQQKSQLSYKPSDVIPFKEAILYHSTLLKRSRPKFEVGYRCSFGLDTR